MMILELRFSGVQSRMLAILVVFFMTCLRSQCFVRIFGLKPLPVRLKSPATITAVSEFSVVRMSQQDWKQSQKFSKVSGTIDGGRQTQATAILGIDRGSHIMIECIQNVYIYTYIYVYIYICIYIYVYIYIYMVMCPSERSKQIQC